MSSNNNILIAQGGGPTHVINQSLAGIIINEKKKKSRTDMFAHWLFAISNFSGNASGRFFGGF